MSRVTRISKAGFVNCYLVEEDDGLTLIDTMLPRSAKKIVGRAAELGKPITRIVLTHAHGDHIGSLDEVAAQLPGVEVLISERDARFLAGDRSLQPGEEIGKLRGAYPKKPLATKPTQTIAAGDRIGSLEVIAAPGHTPGHMALLDTRDRTLYCGDAYTTMGKVLTTAKAHMPFPLAATATWHGPTALATASALRALEPARLAPGHGKVVESPLAAMDAAIARDA